MGVVIDNYVPTRKPNVKKMPGKVKSRFEQFWKLYLPVITKYENSQPIGSDEIKAALKDAHKGRDTFYRLAERSQEHQPKEVQDALSLAYFHMEYIIDKSRVMRGNSVKFKPKLAKRGDKNATVKGDQELLRLWNLYKKKIDGDFGKWTEIAIEKFQKKNRLRVDGVIGKKNRCQDPGRCDCR